MFCPPALSFLGDMELMLYILPPFVIYNPAVSSAFANKEKRKGHDVSISPRPRLSQATWRWFTSPRGRCTSRSGSSPCPRITSVSVCKVRTKCIFSPSSCFLLRLRGALALAWPRLASPASSPSSSVVPLGQILRHWKRSTGLVIHLFDVPVPFVMSRRVNCDIVENSPPGLSKILLIAFLQIKHLVFQLL